MRFRKSDSLIDDDISRTPNYDVLEVKKKFESLSVFKENETSHALQRHMMTTSPFLILQVERFDP